MLTVQIATDTVRNVTDAIVSLPRGGLIVRTSAGPVQIETTLEAVHPVVEGAASFHVRVHRVHVAGDLVTPQGRVDTTRWVPLFYTFRHYFGQGQEVGRNFRAEIDGATAA